MSIEDVLSKLGSVEGINPADLEELTKLVKNPVNTNDDKEREIKEAKAAQSRILQEKKALQSKVQEYEEQLEAIKTGGLSEQEKLKKDMEKLIKTKEAMEKELNDSKASLLKLDRNYKLEKIGSKIKFLDSIPEDLRKYSIESAFKDVEDLDDTSAVDSVLQKYTESYKGIIATESAARGTGDHKQSQNIPKSKKIEDLSDDERAAQIRENKKTRKL